MNRWVYRTLTVASNLMEEVLLDFEVAQNGESGLELAQSELYDLVIIDLGLPGIDGVKVASELRAIGRYAHTPY